MTDRMVLPKVVSASISVRKSLGFGSFTQSSTAATYGTVSFTLANLCSDYSSFVSCFDQYRIEAVEVLFINQSTVAGPNTAAGLLYTVLDFDDSTAFTAITSAQAYDNVITTRAGQDNRRCFQPRVALAAYGSSAFTQFANLSAPWIDSASTTVTHYGVKWALDSGVAGSLQTFYVIVNSVISFRAVR